MDTEQESLFKAMLNNDWFTKSDGDVESPTGYFGWVHNHPQDWFEVAQNFCEIITDPGDMKPPQWFVGVFWASLDSNGIIHVEKKGDVPGNSSSIWDLAHNPAVTWCKRHFKFQVSQYEKWNYE